MFEARRVCEGADGGLRLVRVTTAPGYGIFVTVRRSMVAVVTTMVLEVVSGLMTPRSSH